MNKRVILLVVAMSAILYSFAQVPTTFHFQASLKDNNGVPVDDTRLIEFFIYDAETDGDMLWSEGPVSVEIIQGLFSVELGNTNPFPDDLFDITPLYVTFSVSAVVMTPRQKIHAVPFALKAASSSEEQWEVDGNYIINLEDSIGIGTSNPKTQFEVNALMRLTPTTLTEIEVCNEDREGSIFYDDQLKEYCYCDGGYWKQLDGGGYCECVDQDDDGTDICNPAHPYDTDGLEADCDDDNPDVFTGNPEICDGLDNDCDGQTDEDISGPPNPNQEGVCQGSTQICDGTGGWVEDYSSIPEYEIDETLCDGLDNDCDGVIDDGCAQAQLFTIRNSPDGSVSLPLSSVMVTYTKESIGADNAGFMVQAETDGPALYIEIDPQSLGATAGDLVSFDVLQLNTNQGLKTVTEIAGFTILSSGNSTAGLVQIVTNFTDLFTNLEFYEVELISATGTIASDFSFAGTDFQQAQINTLGITGNSDFRLRVPNDVAATLSNGCTVSIESTPFWRYFDVAQIAVWNASELTILSCCNDGLSNGNETGVDCGGTDCDPCPEGSPCIDDADCIMGNCVEGICSPPCIDNDGDGYGVAPYYGLANGCTFAEEDCDDENQYIYPGADDPPYDGIDQDCNGVNDFDQDLDGFVSENYPGTAGGTSPYEGDCNDEDVDIYPGSPFEYPDDGIDQDCDGIDAITCYVDADADGYGDLDSPTIAFDGSCDFLDGESPSSADCDDTEPTTNPGAPEICGDATDNDCDGLIDDLDPDCNPCAAAENGTPCDDGDPCTQSDECNENICTGTPYSCSDGKPCTTDICDGQGGCTNVIDVNHCLIDGNCYSNGDENPANPCEECNPAINPTTWSLNNQACDDTNPCTHSDICVDGSCEGITYSCSDGKPCTTDICDGQGGCTNVIDVSHCLIAGNCYTDGEVNPVNDCEECNSSVSQTTWTAIATETNCSDGIDNDCDTLTDGEDPDCQ